MADLKYQKIVSLINCADLNGLMVNPFMHNVVKWSKMLLKSCGVNTARFLKYVWPFYNMHERVNMSSLNVVFP